jgi:hypothetical protein
MSIADWNRALESSFDVPADLWEEWLWRCDPLAAPTPEFNRCHLLGLLVARRQARTQSAEVRLGSTMVHGSVEVSGFTLRQLRDACEDLQMHWDRHSQDYDAALTAVDALLARFGQFLWAEHDHDDMASVDAEAPRRVGKAAMRRFTVTFLVLYRHLHLAERARLVEDARPNPDIQSYHVQAALDTFSEHAIHVDLPPAARVVYKQDFAGLYHCVTQVVYFHFPSYARRHQLSLEEVRTGESLWQCLSVALELYPEIPVVYEDEAVGATPWQWMLLSGGNVYLLGPNGMVVGGRCLWAMRDGHH